MGANVVLKPKHYLKVKVNVTSRN